MKIKLGLLPLQLLFFLILNGCSHNENGLRQTNKFHKYTLLLQDIFEPDFQEGIVVLIPNAYCEFCVMKQMSSLAEIISEEAYDKSRTVVVNDKIIAEKFEFPFQSDNNNYLDRTTLHIGNVTFLNVSNFEVQNALSVDSISQEPIQKAFIH